MTIIEEPPREFAPPSPPGDTGNERIGDLPGRQGLSIARAVALCAVFTLLGFGVSRFLDRPQHPGANSSDAGFLRDMMLHHDQAIEMALYELYLGENSDVRQEAVDIVLSQRGEYVLMADRLTAWGLELPDPAGTAMAWMGHPVPARQMPGLATPGQIKQLREAKGRAADLLFLELMINHHQGGVEMAEAAASQADNAWVKDLASRMKAVQAFEINEMRGFAKRLGKDIPPPPPVIDHGEHVQPAS